MTLLGLSLVVAFSAADAHDTDAPVGAAISYTGNTPPDGNFECEEIASDDLDEQLCEAEIMIREAADRDAQLVVLSEGSFESSDLEAVPRIGRRPDSENSPVLAGMANLAGELELYLVVPIHTTNRSGALFSSLVALGPRGRTLAVHHKVELYSEERNDYQAGTRVTTFDTPWGRVAMLLCSDLYAEPELHAQMVVRSQASIVALSSLWTARGAQRWQAALAHDWGVHVIAANGAGGNGVGSGIYAPDGHSLASDDSGLDTVVVASLSE